VIGIVLMGTLHATMACGRRWLPPTPAPSSASPPPTRRWVRPTLSPPPSRKLESKPSLRSLAVEWGNRGIRMNAIAPGPIPTQGAFSRLLPRPELETLALDRNPMHRFGTVEELANLAAFLVSDGSGYINGEVIRMDGGEFLQGAGEFTSLGRVLGLAGDQTRRKNKRNSRLRVKPFAKRKGWGLRLPSCHSDRSRSASDGAVESLP
jgi:hypothetical protein